MKSKTEISDQSLLFEVTENNDNDAFRILFDRYSGRLLNLIYRMIQNYEDSNDILQETFIRIYKNRHECYKMKNFKGWVYTVSLNLARDYLRLRKRKKEVTLNENINRSTNCNPLKNSEKKEAKRKILKAMKKLSSKYRAVFTLRDIEGMSYEEISKILNLKQGTVKSRLNRARVKLAQELEGKI
jgi:RNA polymerase sigma-70 factor (ECF subfamily)